MRFDPEALHQYTEHYARIDPWAAAARVKGRWREGVVELGESLVSRAEPKRTEFLNEFGRRFGLRGGVSAVSATAGPQVAVLSAIPRPISAPFAECTVSLIGALVPHLDRALQTHRRLRGSLRSQTAFVDALDRLSIGVIVFDGQGQVVFQNRMASETLRARDGLFVDRQMVTAALHDDTTRLRNLIAEALAMSSGRVLKGRAMTRLSRPSLRRPYEVLIAPLKLPEEDPFSRNAAAIMFLANPDTHLGTDAERLGYLYDLTPAESRLAVTLLRDRTVEEASDELHISVNTARTHLKRTFQKTGTRRQSELIRRLATGLALVRQR